ncbi:hypothetical protein GCM10025869_25690 [Homoserinibacter gongjuensis]|uniref:Uncharacterized protein n=2 Tax=Homoserinibacter gongjuensis TaxID=1162968 RepID=A0ABQ6JUQ8_9MICO|nr:hypothetical protein GCM10025869_25690 [Homoserinibacter gongjuensis]
MSRPSGTAPAAPLGRLPRHTAPASAFPLYGGHMHRRDWIEHRRADGERVGWMRPEGDGFVPVDLLGRDRAPALDWLSAEELLDELGIGYLAEPYVLERADGAPCGCASSRCRRSASG